MPLSRQLQGKSLEELMDIISRNRWDRLRSKHENNEAEKEPEEKTKEAESDENVSAEEVKLVIFSAQSPFTYSIVEMFKVRTVIAHFENAETMISFCIDHNVNSVLMDIDPPSDCHMAQDIYAALAMLIPDLKVAVCTNRTGTRETEWFKLRNVTVVNKPVFLKQVEWLCSKFYKFPAPPATTLRRLR